jgi:hypothetical protein
MRVAVRIAIPGIGPVRTQATVGAVSVKAFNKATVSETNVAETGVACGDPVAFEAGVVHRDPVAVRRDPMASESGVIHRDPEAAETAVARRDTEPSETSANTVTSAAKTGDTASTAKTADMSSTAKTTASSAAPCERDCADHRCRYAERDGRTCCNQLLTHFSELLMFQTPDVSFDMDSVSTTAVLVLLGLVHDCTDLEGPAKSGSCTGRRPSGPLCLTSRNDRASFPVAVDP